VALGHFFSFRSISNSEKNFASQGGKKIKKGVEIEKGQCSPEAVLSSGGNI